jgi:hypothetical protein
LIHEVRFESSIFQSVQEVRRKDDEQYLESVGFDCKLVVERIWGRGGWSAAASSDSQVCELVYVSFRNESARRLVCDVDDPVPLTLRVEKVHNGTEKVSDEPTARSQGGLLTLQ